MGICVAEGGLAVEDELRKGGTEHRHYPKKQLHRHEPRKDLGFAGVLAADDSDPIRSENRIKAKNDCNGRRPQRGNYL